ncbi:MAG TPA: protein-methionine-sulfoxide reductase catalytic subunit MsrP [Vicinamibacteria bacterium]|nr:protein-methionine-sulfoxide reductase catalytic subunit MsrP [Vicinamibacteria bacterium]
MKKYLPDVPSRDVTPPEIFFGRRRFIASLGMGMVAAPYFLRAAEPDLLTPPYENAKVFPAPANAKFQVPEAIERKDLTPREIAAAHNNFYEFLPGRGGPVWRHAGEFEVTPWKLEVSGECAKPRTFDLDDLLAFDQEERVYHFRCVERWAMNVPWTGFPLSKLLEAVEPKSSAKFVRFVSAVKSKQMPGVREAHWYPWPYHEGLRIDEATNELALVATGVYGKPLLKQHGAPVRIVVPWKYGYKNPKSIVKMELVSKEPETFWQIQPHEYGFLSNVNPFIPHPRWSQAESLWLDNEERFPTPLFNGYERYVAELYPDEPRALQDPLEPGQKAR